ncbi:MAG: RluA family pseudouridine synthase [Bacteroidota bacterium]
MQKRESHLVPALPERIRLSDYLGGIFVSIPSRKGMKKAILKGLVLVNEKPAQTGLYLEGGEQIDLLEEDRELPIFKQSLEVLFEDEHIAVINKPAGLLVSGNALRTVVNALPFNLVPSRESDGLLRPQPAHRLDYPTQGLLLVGKTHRSITALNQAFASRDIQKTYHAVTIGEMLAEGACTIPIENKPAHSGFRVIERQDSPKYGALNLVKLQPYTGRRHQLRIHCAQLGNPILGDKEYGKPGLIQRGNGLYLCATQLDFKHPVTGEALHFHRPLPKKIRRIFGEIEHKNQQSNQ